MSINAVKYVVALGALFISALATAMPIEGQISLTGNVTFDQPIPNATTATISSVSVGAASAQTGVYAGLSGSNTTTTMVTPLVIDPASFIGPQPITGLWVVTDTGTGAVYSFDLTTVLANVQAPGFLNIYGVGVLHATGYDDTSGEWWFTAQGNVASVTFSSTSVPEPSVLALIGLMMLVFAARARRGVSRSMIPAL